jgi:hypothetical protein
MRRLVGLLVVALLLAGTACGASSVSREPRSASADATACPRHVLYRASALASINGVLHAAQRVLRRETLEFQGTRYHLTPRNAPIDYLQRLETIPIRTVPGAALRRLAAKLCGAKVAQASWALHYELPISVIAGQGGYLFFVKTRGGWRFWGYWCGAGHTPGWGRANCR